MCICFSNPDEKRAYKAKKLALIEAIIEAFDGVSRGNGVTLHEAMVIDDYGSPAERAAARAQDTEDKWQDVPEDDIRFSDAVLSFLDAKGFHYTCQPIWFGIYVISIMKTLTIGQIPLTL